jgi:hypothetical protein
MTDAQWKEEVKRISANVDYRLRKFRKKGVTQGIVQFVRNISCYEMRYRGQFICYISGSREENLKFLAVWNTIKTAEETIEKIEGVKHESK